MQDKIRIYTRSGNSTDTTLLLVNALCGLLILTHVTGVFAFFVSLRLNFVLIINIALGTLIKLTRVSVLSTSLFT